MARELFVKESYNKETRAFIEKIKAKEPHEFKKKLSLFFEEKIKDLLQKKISKEEQNRLYLLGSFSRREGSLFSDLDLFYLGSERDANKLNSKIRQLFRKYSLKWAETFEEAFETADDKGKLSLRFARPLFEGQKWQAPSLASCKPFIEAESEKRYARYGKRPGGLQFHLKYSPGALLDALEASLLGSVSGNKKFSDAVDFLYKIRVLNHFYFQSEQVSFFSKSSLFEDFSLSREDFVKEVYKASLVVFATKYPERKCQLESIFKNACMNVEEGEIQEYKSLLLNVEGLVSAPSYHVWLVNEHIYEVAKEVLSFFEKFKDEFNLNQEDLETLVWAALFHDIKKGEKEAHSILGAKAVQDFALKFLWSKEKTENVSWLVREHLGLIDFSLKRDPFDGEFIKRLTARGCYGKKAILLFVLSCADIKGSNSHSWTDWKFKMLKTGLEQILGKEKNLKSFLLEKVKEDSLGAILLEELSAKDLNFVPHLLLAEDLAVVKEDGFAFYQEAEKIWLRCFFERDREHLAFQLVNTLDRVGSYVHRALFKTNSKQQVYNWICIETGVSLKAFQRRFLLTFPKVTANDFSGQHHFKRIRRTYSRPGYALVSFKGKDQKGLLLEAVSILDHAGLSIEWGHAITWGEEIEDVFGVAFSKGSSWSFLTDNA